MLSLNMWSIRHSVAGLSLLSMGCGQAILDEELKDYSPPKDVVAEVEIVNPVEVNPNEFRFPKPAAIAKEENAAQIQLGKDLIERTYTKLPENVKATINCTNCHLNAGTVQKAMPFVGVDDRYPRYRARSGKEDTLAERINGCFERSMNGTKLDIDSAEMNAMLAYMTWISSEVENGKEVEGHGLPKLQPLTPNLENGQLLYQAKCQMCHQADGSGLKTPDGTMLYPPLWGETSFNVGAGMARLHSAAAFIKWNMPFGQGGSLTDQEAYDIAAYFSTQERPDFAHKAKDWPNGGKPDDARY